MSIKRVSDEYQTSIRRVSNKYHAYQTSIRRVSDEYRMSISRVSVEYQTSIMRIWCCDAYQALKRFILAQTRINYPKRSFASCSFLARQKQQNFSLAIDCFTSSQDPKRKPVNRLGRAPPSRDDGRLRCPTSAPTTDPCRLRQGTRSPGRCCREAAAKQTATGNPRPRRADVSCCQDHRRRDQHLTLGYRARRDSLGCLAQRLHHLRVQARRRGQDQSSAPSRVAVVLLLANRPGACQPCHFCAVSILIELALHTKYHSWLHHPSNT